MADISLRFPFNGEYPVSFAFGATSDNEKIKKKFSERGIVGHNGIVGYAGTDFLEGLYRLKFSQFFKVG